MPVWPAGGKTGWGQEFIGLQSDRKEVCECTCTIICAYKALLELYHKSFDRFVDRSLALMLALHESPVKQLI
jgi:hypothetical protein